MKRFSCLAAAVFFLSGSAHAKEPVDSAHVIALAATVTKGSIRVKVEQMEKAADLVRAQLMYVVGHMNGFGGGADLSRAKITLRSSDERSETVEYDAEFTVAWPRGYQFPANLVTVAPVSADAAGKKAFFDRYNPSCASGEEPADAGSFFYYYRPQKNGCPVLKAYDSDIAIPISVALKNSPLQTNNKYPEYEKIWEDRKLVVTHVISTYKEGTSQNDVGLVSYNETYKAFRKYLGNPSQMNVNLGPNQNPGHAYPDIEMTFRFSGDRTVNLNLLLIQNGSLMQPSQKFLNRYNERTLVSDVISYNGHSGLGANIRALSKLGKFAQGRYQIFFINGCDTFTYTDTALEDAIAALNPGTKGTRFLDLITNAMPSPFNGFAQNTVALMGGLLNKSTYRATLANFNQYQKALVHGEEDNRYPEPF